MSDNLNRLSEETRGDRVARLVAWIAICAAGVYFVVYAALFH